MLELEFRKNTKNIIEYQDSEYVLKMLELFNVTLPDDFNTKSMIYICNSDTFKFCNLEKGTYFFGKIFDDHIEFVNYQKNYFTTKHYKKNSIDATPYINCCNIYVDNGSVIRIKDEQEKNQHTIQLAKLFKNGEDSYVTYEKNCSIFSNDKYSVCSVLTKDKYFYYFFVTTKIDNKYCYCEKQAKINSDEKIESIYLPNVIVIDNKKILASELLLKSLNYEYPNIIINANLNLNNKLISFEFKIIKNGPFCEISLLDNTNKENNLSINITLENFYNIITCADIKNIIKQLENKLPNEIEKIIIEKLELYKHIAANFELRKQEYNDCIDNYLRDYNSFEELSFNLFFNIQDINSLIDQEVKDNNNKTRKYLDTHNIQ